ncbi:MAG: DUF4922 domain-containing protein [Bacteroidales bacterium]|nr:DUF4922 domain-containing protein [Bacteroidales bacterium]
MAPDLDKFILDQLSVWPAIAHNYRMLRAIKVKRVVVDGLPVTVQCNPQRLISTAARTDPAHLASRKCFLCGENRPAEQHSFRLEGRKRRKYDVLVNRYPIFPKHLVIGSAVHEPQCIWHRFVDMLEMARQLPDYTIFYNGPHAGASVPDHLHFQACQRSYLPLERALDRLLEEVAAGQAPAPDLEYVASVRDADLYHYRRFARGIFALRATTSKSLAKMFYRLLDCAPVEDGEQEPRFNALAWFTGTEYRAVVMCRRCHRSSHYFAKGPEKVTVSPGCADMAGFLVLPFESDYERMDSELLQEILSEVTVSGEVEEKIIWRLVRKQPEIEVGIMSASEIVFEVISDGAGPQKVSYREGKIDYNGTLYDELDFEAVTPATLFAEPSFILHGVTIGVDFHWQRLQDQTFAGRIKFIPEKGKVTAINVIGVEDYLLSVISSEMKSTADLEFLKAHAVISRSWVMSQIKARREGHKAASGPAFDNSPALVTWLDSSAPREESPVDGPRRIVRWFDHEDHKRFDVCADDHCQRYQGLTMAVGDNVRRAIDETWGEVLSYDGNICDTRFSKCCGGMSELFSTCWADMDYPYLSPVSDPWCGQAEPEVLSKVLNDYDLETRDFYRWSERIPIGKASSLVKERTGVDLGRITALEPLETGPSGRIKILRVTGEKGSIEVGKELYIRRMLSDSHLKSSAFTAKVSPKEIVLEGSGWGHGVGLCQIGAAVMASKGFSYRDILSFYYPGSTLGR